MNELKANTSLGGNHINWIGIARAITILFVVIGHCSYYNIQTKYGGISYFDDCIDYCRAKQIFDRIVSSIYYFHMPMFAMISGMCYNFTLKKITSLNDVVSNKFYRLIIPFIFVSLFISIPIKYITGYYKGSENILEDILNGQILLGGNTHLWFLVSLFEVFVLSYLIGKINLKDCKLYFAFLFLVAVFANKFNNDWFGIVGTAKLLFFFEIGRYYFSKIENFTIINGYVIIIHVIFFNILSQFLLSIHLEHGGSLLLIPREIIALYGCYILTVTSKWINQKGILHNFFTKLDKDSFGIYLFSDPFNYIILAIACPLLHKKIFTSNDIFILMTLTRFILTLLASILLNKLVRNLKI
jgi:fucose 4-O-acetylase-like acetyltransferase